MPSFHSSPFQFFKMVFNTLASLPGMQTHRLIVLNNVFMSQKYRDVCGKKPGDPALP